MVSKAPNLTVLVLGDSMARFGSSGDGLGVCTVSGPVTRGVSGSLLEAKDSETKLSGRKFRLSDFASGPGSRNFGSCALVGSVLRSLHFGETPVLTRHRLVEEHKTPP